MHTIRLRGPWQLEPIARFVPQSDGTYRPASHDLPPPVKVTMPADWSKTFGHNFLGRVRYHRVFQKPTGLESGESVSLVVEPPRSRCVVKLGGKPLGNVIWDGPPGRFHITDLLDDHNRLEIIVEHPVLDETMRPGDDYFSLLPGGLVGEVRLEIEE
jgi:hypothetical protein